MENDSSRICLCPLEGIITTISKKWAILVISILGHHERLRFNDMMNILGGDQSEIANGPVKRTPENRPDPEGGIFRNTTAG